MKYPTHLEKHFGSAAAFTRRCKQHPAAPRPNGTDEMGHGWRRMGTIPWAWRPVVADIEAEVLQNSSSNLQEAS